MRTGTWVTASAHIITAVVGSGVLSLAWAITQLGWVAGPVTLIIFSLITLFTSTLLADAYRHPDPVTGQRNYTYMDAVRAHLGGLKVRLCGLAQYANLVGVTVGYTITASMCMATICRSVRRKKCLHAEDNCHVSTTIYMIIFGSIQLILCQVPNFHKLSWISILAAVMSITYSFIGLGLSVAKVAAAQLNEGAEATTTWPTVSEAHRLWKVFQAIGNIAFAYAYSTVLIEIQDTLKSSPAENKTMKRASFVGISTTTIFYLLCGCVGYAAFGEDAPGDLLSGFHQPLWLLNVANVSVTIHLIGAYQVFAQPIFSLVESSCRQRWPEVKFVTTDHQITIPFLGGTGFHVNCFRLVWRSAYVIVTTVLAMLLPFFNVFLALIGAASFWPLTVYFPIEMYIARAKLPKFSFSWMGLQALSLACLLVSLVAAAGSVEGLIQSLKVYHPFKN
ncbi:unnamed protein product [Linum tenue]|uniref:Amino acid transporter transmembrane domain-containing protein n=1 Tax=Linum tenue TaxID=586396 RepID=A0AAV0KNA0_9ROSI|nr:unnamed protein product [Linum tenue]